VAGWLLIPYPTRRSVTRRAFLPLARQNLGELVSAVAEALP
jgi:hypothetical protein